MTVRISSACTACGACLITCPTAALTVGRGRPAVIDSRCTDCLACVEVCPADAVSLVSLVAGEAGGALTAGEAGGALTAGEAGEAGCFSWRTVAFLERH